MINIREQTEKREEEFLSPYAALSKNTKGRRDYCEPCNMRTEYQRDRDRIIHSKAFRRLKHKTQVFISPEGDHYRTRLTHTLEVAQIARTVARALCLNEDLVEAIALGHDLGHTPFGHAGERILNEICPYGFKHYEQSIRVVEDLEKLNLTYEVLDGIANHAGNNTAQTLEGQIIKYADRIGYISHDIDDAERGGIIKADDVPEKYRKILGNTHGERIDTMVGAIISESYGKNIIKMTDEIEECMMGLRKYLFENVYKNPKAKGEESKTVGIVKSLYEYFIENPKDLPEDYITDDIPRSVCDYIAGMSDRYAMIKYREIFIPNVWQVL